MQTVKQTQNTLQRGFFGFWVKYWKFTFLVAFLILFFGVYSLYVVPKESTPEINISTVLITTAYPGANPTDIDSLISKKIEDAVKDIDGMDKVTSNSYLNVSSVVLTFENDTDMIKAVADVEAAVDKVELPDEAKDPIVKEIVTSNTLMFNAIFYAKDKDMSLSYLKERVKELKDELEGKGAINKIEFDTKGNGQRAMVGLGGSSDNIYEIQILLNKDKTEQLGLTVQNIQQTIQAWNQNWPLGNYTVGELNYDFRVEGELENIDELKNIPIYSNAGTIELSDIAEIKKVLVDDTISKMGLPNEGPYNYVTLGMHKIPDSNIFVEEKKAKQQLEEELKKLKYDGIGYVSTVDLGEIISDDYNQLAKNMLQTFVLVFISLLIFIGFKESIIATISLPLAFLITFIFLNQLGLTLNFLTNFSLIVSLGIAIDTTIVVIEGAHERLRQGFRPKNAILLAVHDYKLPLITGTATTIMVFVPMMTLPGIMGAFLAYIPITIFLTLLAALFISLTINSALYYKLSKNSKYYETDIGGQQFMPDDIKALLEHDREGKVEKQETHTQSKREKYFDRVNNKYSNLLSSVMKSAKSRFLAIVIPVGLLILTLAVISPSLGFTLMPQKDSGMIEGELSAKKGTSDEIMKKYIPEIAKVLSTIPELKSYHTSIDQGTITIAVDLINTIEREKKGQRTDAEVIDWIYKEFEHLTAQGLELRLEANENGPPGSKAVGIKLVVEDQNKIDTMIEVAKDFEKYMQSLSFLRNISISSQDSPGEFVYTYDQSKLKSLGMLPIQISSQVYSIMNSSDAGTIKKLNNDFDIKVLFKDYNKNLTVNDIGNIKINTPAGQSNFSDITQYSLQPNLASISREDGKILVKVEADVVEGMASSEAQKTVVAFAEKYDYPEGVQYEKGGETQENADLIMAVGVSFLVALLVIFSILLLQFNSYSQPLVIMYSIAMGLLGANIGLFLFGLPYSLMFLIGFIALSGVIVNDSIVFIDKINVNLKRGMDRIEATTSAGKSRLQPIILTTLTTVLGLSSIMGDAMWKPLAITMMFGMVTGSLSTLFVTPALYYDIGKIKHLIRKNALAPILFLIPIGAIYLLLLLVEYFVSGTFMSGMTGILIFAILVLVYIVFYVRVAVNWMHMRGASPIQATLGFSPQDVAGDRLSKKKIYRMISLSVLFYVVPIIIGGILFFVFGNMMIFVGSVILLYGILGIINIYTVWNSPLNQTWLSKKLGIVLTPDAPEKD